MWRLARHRVALPPERAKEAMGKSKAKPNMATVIVAAHSSQGKKGTGTTRLRRNGTSPSFCWIPACAGMTSEYAVVFMSVPRQPQFHDQGQIVEIDEAVLVNV